MRRLYVWVRRPDGTARLAGELATTEPLSGGRFESEFEYAAEWVQDPGAFPLDPVSLPLRPSGRRFGAEQFTCVDQVVEAVRKFRATARKLAVRSGKGLDLISADVQRRIELLAR